MPVTGKETHEETKETAEELLEQLNGVITATRNKTEALEKKYDGLDVAVIEENKEKIAEISGKIADIKTVVDGQEKFSEYIQQIEDLKDQQAILAASSGTKKKEDGEEISEEMKAFKGMLRSHRDYKEFEKHNDAVAEGIVTKEFDHIGNEERKEHAKKDMSVGSDPDGGYFVPTQFGGMIIGRIFETSPLRSIASVISMSNSEIEFVLDDQEAESGWVGEVQDRPDTATPQVGQIIIPAHEQYAQPKATQKLLDDAGISVDSWLAGKVADKLSRTENTAFVTGDGAQKPKGFLSYAAWTVAGVYQRNAIEQIDSGIADNFNGDSFKLILASLKENYQGNAVFGMKRVTWGEVTQLKDSQNRYLFNMIDNFKTGDTFMILGKDVVLMNDMPVVAADALPVVYGDFSEGYTIADRIGIRILRDPFTSKPFVKFYTTKRVGGAVTNYEALKIMKISL